jgi:hypothetical protein
MDKSQQRKTRNMKKHVNINLPKVQNLPITESKCIKADEILDKEFQSII